MQNRPRPHFDASINFDTPCQNHSALRSAHVLWLWVTVAVMTGLFENQPLSKWSGCVPDIIAGGPPVAEHYCTVYWYGDARTATVRMCAVERYYPKSRSGDNFIVNNQKSSYRTPLPWCHNILPMSLLRFCALIVVKSLLFMEGQRALRFHQKYFTFVFRRPKVLQVWNDIRLSNSSQFSFLGEISL